MELAFVGTYSKFKSGALSNPVTWGGTRDWKELKAVGRAKPQSGTGFSLYSLTHSLISLITTNNLAFGFH